ncbi:MAG: SH3 domain-containing protein [Clostridia bacterium]|nr:SH3 domain-containing protein [Clostridia bacterium]
MKKLYSFIAFVFMICIISSAQTFTSSAADKNSSAGLVATASTSLNLRSSASTASSVVASAGKGTYLTLLKKEGSWYKVEYTAGKTAWAHAGYINAVSSEAMVVSTSSGNLNVRSSASATAQIITSLPKGTCVVRLSQKNGFSRILYGGNRTGYVSSAYLSSALSTATYKKISLSVPSYKQTDSRWADIKIGTQGDTVKTSGCTTTALAMTESFHSGKTVTPADMVKRLNYSSSGMLYWPTDYSTELISSSDYLKKIYDLLAKGKPVILGMKKSNGSQHWVVVTGHSKSTASLSAADFTINDPGSNSRTLLSEFIAAYPNTYKIACKK